MASMELKRLLRHAEPSTSRKYLALRQQAIPDICSNAATSCVVTKVSQAREPGFQEPSEREPLRFSRMMPTH